LGDTGFVGALAGEEAVRLKWGRGWMSLDGCGQEGGEEEGEEHGEEWLGRCGKFGGERLIGD